MKRRLSSQQKFWVTAAAAGLLVAALGGTLFSLSSAVQRANAMLDSLEEKLRTVEDERASARLLKKILAVNEKELQKLRGFFVERERPVEFIEYLEEVARQSRNSLILDVTESEPGQPLTFRLTVDGSERSVAKYLALLESMRYRLEIKEFSFQRLDSTSRSREREQAAIVPTARLMAVIEVGTTN